MSACQDGFGVARAPDRYVPAAHTLTEALLPTTCVVVNKPPALKHFPTIGLTPDRQKVVHAYREVAAAAYRAGALGSILNGFPFNHESEHLRCIPSRRDAQWQKRCENG